MVFRIDVKKLFALCASKQMTVRELAEIAKCSTATLMRACKNKPLRALTVGKLAAALNVDVTELLAEQ